MRKSYKMGTFSEARFYEALFAKLQSLGVWPNNLSFEEQGGRRLFRRTIEFGTAKNVFLSLWDGSRFIKYNYAGLPNRTIKLQSVTLDQGVSSKARSLKTISVYELQQPSTLAKLKNYYQGHCEALGSENNLLAIQQQKNKIQDALKPKNPHQRAVASATMPKPQALHKKDKSLFITWGTEKYEKRFFVEDKKKVRVLGRTTCQ